MRKEPESVKFLGVTLTNFPSESDVLAAILSDARGEKSKFLVTPNADHVVKLNKKGHDELRRIYAEADYTICDSRVLSRLAGFLGMDVFTYPGSDLVRDMLTTMEARNFVIGIVGPSEADFMALDLLYPQLMLSYFPSPARMEIGAKPFDDCAKLVAVGNWDILLICLGFPKQEFLFEAIQREGQSHGITLCVGASVDFLIGKQKRAPLLIQKLSLEWVFRLASSPRRLWRRYILGLPALIRLYVVLEVWPRLCGRYVRT